MAPEAILARNLKRLRARRGLSQETLADEAGVNRTYLGDLENANHSTTLNKLAALAKALGVKPSDLIDDEFAP